MSLDTGKKVIPNTNFNGLSYETSTELRAYMHLRMPKGLQGIALMQRPGILKTDDFLDCLDKDQPKGNTNLKIILYYCYSILIIIQYIYIFIYIIYYIR